VLEKVSKDVLILTLCPELCLTDAQTSSKLQMEWSCLQWPWWTSPFMAYHCVPLALPLPFLM